MLAISTKAAAVGGTVVPITGMGFAAGDLAKAQRAVISARTNGAMATWDGTDPTGTLGHLVAKDAAPLVVAGNGSINALKFLQEASSSAAVTVTLEIY